MLTTFTFTLYMYNIYFKLHWNDKWFAELNLHMSWIWLLIYDQSSWLFPNQTYHELLFIRRQSNQINLFVKHTSRIRSLWTVYMYTLRKEGYCVDVQHIVSSVELFLFNGDKFWLCKRVSICIPLMRYLYILV